MANRKARILVIDDDSLIRRSCERILGNEYTVESAENGREGIERLSSQDYHVALVDLKLPDISGVEILQHAPDRFPDIPLIIITGYATIKTAVQAIKIGAFDYVSKPFTPDDLRAVVEKALRQRRLLADYRELRSALEERYHVGQLLGESHVMKDVLAAIAQVAPTDSTVLLTGESGTGKELAARAIHLSGPRKEARFVAVDCGAIPANLIASELFGHVRGAFTDAKSDRPGLVQTADGGTLFLDEISNLPPDLQATLLRAIEEREVRPVGASKGTTVDVRFIAATNCDLRTLVKEGGFREDLFYRLNVFPIHLPPLRERRQDIPLLAQHFLNTFSTRMHKQIGGFTPEAMDLLKQYGWPGNVRELSNVVERLVILCNQDRVGQAHLRESLTAPQPTSGMPQTAAELAFADADYGVDPMVTGPVSASFKQQQAGAGCAEATWPDIPLDCYPNR